ncbi:MAG: restriction endonuclease subunit S [Holdemanella porci]
MRKLTDLCDIQYGYAFDSSYFTEDSSYIPIVRIRDVKRGFSKTHYSSIFPVEYVIHKGDLLVGMDGEFNIAKWQSSDALLNQRVCKLTAKEGMNKEYLRYAMIKALKDLENKTSFVTVKHLTAKELNRLELNVPSVAIQNQRENTLSALEKIMHFRSKQLKSLDDLIKARFIEMFGDPVLNERKFPTLSGADFFKLSNGRAVPDEKRIETGIPAYGGNGISWYTDEFLMAEDTIVVGRVGFQSGNVHYVIGPLWITDNAMYISQYDKDKFNLRFLCELMQHVNFSRFQDAGDLKKITQKPFMTFKYILPSMDLQQKFVNFKIEVDKSREEVKEVIRKNAAII